MGWIVGKGIGIPFRMGGGVNWANYWLTRTPSTLALTNTGYPEGIKLDWLNGGAGYDGTSIERSADGVTYAEIATVASGILTYTDSTSAFATTYYYRVRSFKGTNYSQYSNVESLEVTSDRFMFTVVTNRAGSANDTFVLPVASNDANYYIDWGDGGAEELFTNTGNKSHTYASAGTYLIKLRSTGSVHIKFNNGGDKVKMDYINNWGSCVNYLYQAFDGCTSLKADYKDAPRNSILSMSYAFRNCTSWNGSLSGWTFVAADWSYTFLACTNFNQYISPSQIAPALNLRGFLYLTSFNQSLIGWNTENITNMTDSFRNIATFKQSLAPLSIKSATNITDICYGTNINDTGTTTNYDATLISWSAQAVLYSKTALNTNFGTSKYGEGLVDSGTTDGVSAGKLIQSGQNFLTTVTVGDVVYNTTDGTYAFVTGIDSDTQLSISVDIMASGENYRIQHSDAAKARAQLVIPTANGGQGWTITDGGYA